MQKTEVAQIEFSRIARILKIIIKKQGRTYEDIAKILNMSESGFKKLMTAQDSSLNRISKICQILEVPLQKVLDEACNASSGPTPLTPEQRRALNSDENLYRILACLQMVDYELKTVCKLFQVTKEELYPYLKKLDALKLIEWKNGDKIKTFAPMYYDFAGITPSWREGKRLVEDVLAKSGKPDLETTADWACRVIRVNPMRRELLEEMNSKIQKLIDNYMWQNTREWEIYPKKDMVRVGWVYASFPFGLEDSFGKAKLKKRSSVR